MRIGSLFSGYGGLDMGVQAVLGGEVAWHVEYDKAPSRILAHHWPDIPNFGDVTAVDFTKVEPVDILTGGYPCQPFSHAGNRKGTNDERHLWPHVLRAICEMGPSLVVLENVRGHLSLGFDTVLADLASVGWSAEWGVVRASDTGAPHQRARLFIVAYPERQGRCGQGVDATTGQEGARASGDIERRSGKRLGTAADAKERAGWSGVGQEASQRRQGVNESGGCPTADASGERHGARQDPGGMGRLDSEDAGGPREREWAREVAGDRGAAAVAHPEGAERGGTEQQHLGAAFRPAAELGERTSTDWGGYAPAIARWEHVLGRPAPAPTEPGRTGQSRLSPAFVEWMMGLPAGWVTDPAIGISRNDQLKALGNGVVPQQAALALSLLRDHMGVAA